MASKMTQIEEMKKELEYPTAKEVFDRYLELAPDNDDIDDAVYDVICEWDEQFAGDTTWCNDEETDVKDRLQDEVLERLGEK
jgi:outer membrane protein assembly factor BamD (BamD/ComL family)